MIFLDSTNSECVISSQTSKTEQQSALTGRPGTICKDKVEFQTVNRFVFGTSTSCRFWSCRVLECLLSSSNYDFGSVHWNVQTIYSCLHFDTQSKQTNKQSVGKKLSPRTTFFFNACSKNRFKFKLYRSEIDVGNDPNAGFIRLFR